jgi:hypothetical protein
MYACGGGGGGGDWMKKIDKTIFIREAKEKADAQERYWKV